MSRGASGRIVLEVDPETKRELYSTLAREGLTLKAWFLLEAKEYIDKAGQPRLNFAVESRSRHDQRDE